MAILLSHPIKHTLTDRKHFHSASLAKTGATLRIPLKGEISNLLLGDDGVVVVTYARELVIFDRTEQRDFIEEVV